MSEVDSNRFVSQAPYSLKALDLGLLPVFHDVGSQAVISVWRISCRRSIRLSMSGIRLSTYSNVSIGHLLQD